MRSRILLITWLLLFVSTATSQNCTAYSAFVVVDGSASITEQNFEKVKTGVKDFVNESISQNHEVRIGVIVFGDDVTNEINASSSIENLVNQTGNITFPNEGTATHLGILRAQELLELEPSVNPRVMIVITDGASGQPNKTKAAAAAARAANTTMVALGIDEAVKPFKNLYDKYKDELKAIADSEDLRLRIDLFGPFATNLTDIINQWFLNISSDTSCGEIDSGWQGSEKSLTQEQVQQLDDAYNFTSGVFGPFIFGQSWRSEEVLLCTGAPQVNAYILLLNDGICGRWAEWQEDRFYHSHEGKAIIDKFSPNGTLVSECLGSTARDPDCRYVVKIPRNWIANIRTIGKLAIFTSVIINGNNDGGQNYPLEYMYDRFGGEHSDIIDQTVKCYQQ